MSTPPPAAPWTLRGALEEGWSAARKNWRAILFIQILAILTVVFYYASPPFAAATSGIGPYRDRMGLPFSFVVGFVSGGLIPEIAKLVTGQTKRLDRKTIGHILFVGLVYGLLGVFIDVFYKLQGFWFGNGTDLGTVAIKLFVDMAIAAPTFFIPYSVGMFLWREKGFRIREIPGFFNRKTYRERFLTIQVINWFVWIPVLSAIYTLPLALQFPLASLIEACWSLLLVVMATEAGGQKH